MPLDPTLCRLTDEFPFWTSSLVTILGEDRQPVPWVLNPPQERLHGAEEQAMRDGIRKFVIPKARREGVTTYYQGRALHDCWRAPDVRCLTLAHTDEDTSTIFRDSAQYMYANLPDDFRPSRSGRGVRSIHLDRLNSQFSIATAGGKAPGRGSTLSRVHISEAAYVAPNVMDALRSGLQEAVRKGVYAEESTGNGCAGGFYETCMETQRRAYRTEPGIWYGRNGWCMVFLPWFLDPRNVVLLPPGATITPDVPRNGELPEQCSGEAEVIAMALNTYRMAITTEQLAWRRSKKASARQRRDFPQEYPETVDQCFRASGASRFDGPAIARGMAACPDQPMRVDIVARDGATGEIAYWAEPRRDALRGYLVICDPSEGVQGGDPACISVHEWTSFEQVARFHGFARPAELGRICVDLCTQYSGAMATVLVVERENHGHSVLNTVQNQLNWPNVDAPGLLYCFEPDRPGYSANRITRPLQIDGLAEILDEGGLTGVIRDKVFWSECPTFERQKSGKYEAVSPSHDDTIMCISMGLYIRELMDRSGQGEIWETPDSWGGGFGS